MLWAGIAVAIGIVGLAGMVSASILGWARVSTSLKVAAKIMAVLALGVVGVALLGVCVLLLPGGDEGEPLVPLVSLDLPREARAGDPVVARLTVHHPGDPDVRLQTPIEEAIAAVSEPELEARLFAPGFDVAGGEPERQGLGRSPNAAEWAWSLTSQADESGEREVEVSLFIVDEDRGSLDRIGSLTTTVTVESGSTGIDRVLAFLRDFGVPVVSGVTVGTVMVFISFHLNRRLERRRSEGAGSERRSS